VRSLEPLKRRQCRRADLARSAVRRNAVPDATSLSELLVGIEILPKGKRKAGLVVALTELMTSCSRIESCRSMNEPRSHMRHWSPGLEQPARSSP